MKILILCDLHNEFGTFKLEQVDCDAVVLAGDIDLGVHGAKWALEAFKKVPIIYVCGNHEYYSKKIYKVHSQLRELSKSSNLFFLEKDELILDNVRFLGCTLWTDFSLYGPEKRNLAMYEAQIKMTDFNSIRLGPEQRYRKLKPSDTISFYSNSVRFLQDKLQKPFSGSTVIVTHHSPTSRSISDSFEGNILNPSFCSDLEWMIVKYKPTLWIHGHIHAKLDFMIGDTHIICNSRGYSPKTVKSFQKDLIVEL